ncbi:MAG: UDP-N-acetylmuramate--L-alanine ligase [Bacteroidia bacterium]|nr:UDP-N-acetylmuramate--L-alanine ligase [Bacteroidia bacterium]
MNKSFQKAYFIGVGGIGMSAICRYLLEQNISVWGYDKTRTDLTIELEGLGVSITYNDAIDALPMEVKSDLNNTLFVYTPAIPKDHPQWIWLQEQGITLHKRSQILGLLTQDKICLAVAGTHGKTTTSTLLAHLLKTCNVNFSAFLGGISSNYQSNYISHTNGIQLFEKDIVVVEADEFDRSFHQLRPDAAIITAIDADHLDIYGDSKSFFEAFKVFAELISPEKMGDLYLEERVQMSIPAHVKLHRYGTEADCAFTYENVRIENHQYVFDLQGQKFVCGLPGHHNVSNATAAAALCLNSLKIPPNQIANGVASFKGVKRRFEFLKNSPEQVIIDDYAHHPEEIKAIIKSVRTLYPEKKITGVFQPHLFSRTRDFAQEFAESLSLVDELILMDIYPAREKPIEGITSEWLLSLVTHQNKSLLDQEQILEKIKSESPELILIMGAGDIDRLSAKLRHHER